MKRHLWALSVFLAMLLIAHVFAMSCLNVLQTQQPEPIGLEPQESE